MPSDFLPYGRQSINDDDIQAVVECLKGDWLTTGPQIDRFEEAFAAYCGARYAVCCSSGTAALHLAQLALKTDVPVKALVPTITFLATANSVLYAGGEVRLCDVSPETGLIDLIQIEEGLGRGEHEDVSMIVPVHMGGQTADMERLWELAKEQDWTVIEDACHALGTQYASKDGALVKVGSCRHSHMAIFSLHPVKTMTTGEGGVITTNDEAAYEKLKSLRSHGMTRTADDFVNKDQAFAESGVANPWYYEMQALGFNYRLTDFQAALGLSQLKRVDQFINQRTKLVECYDQLFADLDVPLKSIERHSLHKTSWHLYQVLINFEALNIDRATLCQKLREALIGVQVHYIPLHMQPFYSDRYGPKTLPGGEAFYAQTLSLPLFPDMEEGDCEKVAKTIIGLLGDNLK